MATDVEPELLTNLDCRVEKLDVTDRAAVFDLIGRLPRLGVLFNCAGFVHHGTLLACDDAAWDFSFNLNVRSMFCTMQAALPKMLEAGGGSIVNMSSVASSVKGAPSASFTARPKRPSSV